MKNIKLSLIALIILFAGCRKLISVAPPLNVLTKDKIYSDSASTEAVVVNTYALLDKTVDPNLTPFLGLYADELNYSSTNPGTTEFQKSTISTTNSTNLNIWKNYYAVIYQCNDIIQQLSNYNGIKIATKNQFISEVKFLRAYSYFYLTNLYGSVPLLLVTDVNITSVAARTDSATVYHQIIQDLTDAQSGLPISYIGTGRVRANSLTATALLARVYLYQNKYAKAESTASTVISSGLYTPLQPPSSVFLAGSNESILQLYTQNGYVTEAPSIIPSSGKPTYPITTQLLNSFEPNDLRKTAWLKSSIVTSGGVTTTYYSPYKYHNRTLNTTAPEYLAVLRIGEQYLIRAEARLKQGNVNGAVSDLNVVRQRAGLSLLSTAIDATTCMNALIHERQIELFAEWGNRFLDLKRNGLLNSVLGTYKTTWKSIFALLPIPQNERIDDPDLSQNQGY